MTNDEAKFILRAYRPSGRDANEPTFTEALQQTRLDPILADWFALEQAHDEIISAKLNEVMPPSDLREKILAGGRVSQKIEGPRRHLGAWLALAASVVLVFALSEVWQGRRLAAAQSQYAHFVLADAQSGGHHAATGVGMDELLSKLAREDMNLPGNLALEISDLKAGGCRTVKYGKRDAVELCFNRDGTWYHLYMMRRDGGFGPLLKKAPALLSISEAAVAVWADGDYDYAVVSPKGMAALKKLTS